jgi:trypsin
MKTQFLSTATILLLLGNLANANLFTSSSSSSSSVSNLEIRESNTSLRGSRARPHKAANAPPPANESNEKRLAERRKRQKIKQLQNRRRRDGGRKKKDTDKPPKRERPNKNKKNQNGKQRPNKKNQNGKKNNKPDRYEGKRPNGKRPNGKRPNAKKPGKNQDGDKKKNLSVLESGHRYPDRARIIGGTPVKGVKYAASLQDNQGHFCGGSIITASSILTAAHCQGGQYSIAVGRDEWDSNTGQEIRMSKEVPYPQYDEYTTDSDWMVVHLAEPIDLSQSNVGLVKLNQQSSMPAVGDKVTVVGWGVTKASGAGGVSDKLMQVSVNCISNDECDASGNHQDNYNGQITQNMLCAKVNGGGKDSCQGDSGGPLTNDVGEQVGVVSWGVGCADPDFPGVYARVSKAYDWIEKTVCDNNAEHAKEAGFDCDNASFTPSSTAGGGSGSSGGSSGGGSYQPSGSDSWGDDYSSFTPSSNHWDDDWSWDDDYDNYKPGGGNDWSWDDDYSNYKPSGGGNSNWFMNDDYNSYKPTGGGGNNNNHDDYYSFSAYDWGGGYDGRPSSSGSRFDDDFDWDWDDWGGYDDWW